MQSTVKAAINKEKNLLLIGMDEKVDRLRKSIWQTIFAENSELKLSPCDISMVLGLVQYELVHHLEAKDLE